MEIEFKFVVPAERLNAVERALRAEKTTRTRLQARYFDTADAALARHGVVLRLRKEGTHWVQTAKAVVEGQGALHRLEHNVPLDAGAVAVPDPSRHAGSPVGKLLDKALGHRDAVLVETLSTDISRLARHAHLGATTVELALDVGRVTGAVMGGAGKGGKPRKSAVCELEIEIVEGRVEDLVRIAGDWCRRHGLWFSTLSKAERGQRLAHAAGHDYAVKATPPQFIGSNHSGLSIQRAVLAACLAQVLPNASELASGNEDAEVVHQLRVGIRRLRTALRELSALSAEDGSAFDAAWQPALTAAFRRLGAARDTTVLHSTMAPRLEAAGAPPIRLARRKAESADLGAAVRAADFQAALVGLIGFAAPIDTAEEAGSAGPRRLLKKRLQKLHHQLLRDGARFESLPTAAQHRVRKRLKRLRYLLEFVGPLFDAKAAAEAVAQLAPAQDALGRFNDAHVALAAYRDAAAKDSRAWFAVGWLTASQVAEARACRKALQRLGKLRAFWKKRR